MSHFIGCALNLILLIWSSMVFFGIGVALISGYGDNIRRELGLVSLPFDWMVSKPFAYALFVFAALFIAKEFIRYGSIWKRVLTNLVVAVMVAFIANQEFKVEMIIRGLGSQ